MKISLQRRSIILHTPTKQIYVRTFYSTAWGLNPELKPQSEPDGKNIDLEPDGSYDRRTYFISTLYLICTALLHIAAELNQTTEQKLNNHSAQCAQTYQKEPAMLCE